MASLPTYPAFTKNRYLLLTSLADPAPVHAIGLKGSTESMPAQEPKITRYSRLRSSCGTSPREGSTVLYR